MAFNWGASTNKPTLNLSGSTLTNNNPGTSFFSQPQASNQQNTSSSAPQGLTSTLAGSTNNPTSSSSNPQIDIAHLRSTTKFDHLTPDLQQEIYNLDTAILNQIRQSTEVSDLIPAVVAAGSQTAPGIEFVSTKLEELETGLENDAEAIVNIRDGDLKQDEGEAKCVFRAVDRLKIPRQYQVGHTVDIGANGAVFGGVGNGLSGWWNHPSTLRGSSVRAGGAGGQNVQLVDEDLDDENAQGPKNLVELFAERTKEMSSLGERHRELLDEIENFVDGLEVKVGLKEREISDKLEFGKDEGRGLQEERDHQMQLLKFVFGEVQKNLYEVAEKVGSARDGVVDLGLVR